MTNRITEMLAKSAIDNSEWQVRDNLKTRKRLRRVNQVHKTEALYELINYTGFCPEIGYLSTECEAHHIVGSGCYIKYLKNSKSQKDIKRKTTRRMRKHNDIPTQKGYYYRKLLGEYNMLY